MQEIYNDATDQEVFFDCVEIVTVGETTTASPLYGSTDGELMTGAVVALKEYKKTTASISSPVISWVQALNKWKLIVPPANVTQYGYGLITVTKADLVPVTIEFKTVHEDTYFAGADVLQNMDDRLSSMDTTVSGILQNLAGMVSNVWSNESRTLTTDIKAQAASALADFDTATPIAKTSELATITGGGTATLDSLETDISEISITGTSAVKVVHPDYYAFDASEKTITLSSPYNTVTVEQVLRIKDLTTNYIIYDCEDSKYDDIPISIVGGVLTYTAPARDAADTDLLQITVNMV